MFILIIQMLGLIAISFYALCKMSKSMNYINQ